MTILPVSGLINYSVKPLTFKGVNNSVAPQSDKHVTTKDIPYSYPISFKGKEVDMKQRLEDSNWAKSVFEKYGMKAKIDKKDGLLTISEFKNKPDYTSSYENLDIDVEKLLKNVKKINGDADLSEYKNICLPNLKTVGGILKCRKAEGIKFPELKTANKIDCLYAKEIKFDALTTANEIDCAHAEEIEFLKLKTVKGSVGCYVAERIKFPVLKTAGYIDCLYANGIDIPKATNVEWGINTADASNITKP